MRIDRARAAALAAVTVLVVASNLLVMKHGYDFMRVESQTAKVDLGALELLGHAAPPDLMLTASVAHDPYLSGVTAGRYFAVRRVRGAPPFSSAEEIASSPVPQREAADSVLVSGYGIAARPAPAGGSQTGCARLAAGVTQAGPPTALAPRGAVVRNLTGVPLVMGVSHFAPSRRPTYFGFLAGGGTARVDLPAAAASIRWRLSLTTAGRAALAGVLACQP